jgi:hypothetical protein
MNIELTGTEVTLARPLLAGVPGHAFVDHHNMISAITNLCIIVCLLCIASFRNWTLTGTTLSTFMQSRSHTHWECKWCRSMSAATHSSVLFGPIIHCYLNVSHIQGVQLTPKHLSFPLKFN